MTTDLKKVKRFKAAATGNFGFLRNFNTNHKVFNKFPRALKTHRIFCVRPVPTYLTFQSISAMGTGARFRRLPKQPVEQQVSPSPKCSPSSRDWGIGWLSVSGNSMVSTPDSKATTANTTDGTRGSNESCNRVTCLSWRQNSALGSI